MGTYTGSDGYRKSGMGYNYLLELKEDGTCKFIMYQDLHSNIGLGRWTNQGKIIMIEYDNRPATDISELLMAGSYLRGVDTLEICSSNKLKKEKISLRRRK